MTNPLHMVADGVRGHAAMVWRARPRSPGEVLAILPGVAAVAILAWMAWRIVDITVLRVGTFHELEFQEGDVALNAMRVLNGQEQYPARDGNFIPLLYTPLYNHAVAAVMWLSGSTALWTGRVVSIAATLGCLKILSLWTWRETRSVLGAVAAPLLFLSVAPLTGWWFDLCRVDMLYLFLTGAGAWALLDRRAPDQRWEIAKGILAGVLLVLAALTKQTAGPFAIGLTGVAIIVSPLRAVWAVTTALTLGFMALVHLYYTNTDFWFYCFEVLKNHRWNLWGWQERLRVEFFQPALLPLVLVLVGAAVVSFRRQWRLVLLLAALVIGALMSIRGLLKEGGYVNQWLLTWWLVAAALGILIGWWVRPGPQWRGAEMLRGAGDAVPPHALPGLAWLAVAVWMALQTGAVVATRAPGAWLPAVSFPSARIAHLPEYPEGGRRVIEAIRDLPGSVWVMHFNYYAHLAGRPTEIGIDNVRDLTIGGQPVSPYALDLLRRRQYDYLLLNNTAIDSDWLDGEVREAIRANYDFAEDWEAKYGFLALRPVDNAGQKPRALWKRKSSP